MTIPIHLEGVEETLLIPLWARAKETERPDALVRDPHAVGMMARLDYDFSKYERDKATPVGIAIRSKVLDEAARDFLAANPNAVILNLAAGLDTRFFRVGEAARCWYEVDLPNVMALRQRFFEESERHRFVAGSVLEPDWLDAIDALPGTPVLVLIEGLFMYLTRSQIQMVLGAIATRFPGAEVVAEMFGRGVTFFRWRFHSVGQTNARFRGGIESPHELTKLVPGIQILHTWYPMTMYPERWGWMGLGGMIPIVRTQYKIVRLRAGTRPEAATAASST